MSLSPKSTLVREKIDQNYEKQKRSSSLRWIVINGVLFSVFAYDLCCKCSEYTTVLHYIQLCITAVLAANTLQHGLRLASSLCVRFPSRRVSPSTLSRSTPESDLQASWQANLLARPWRRDHSSPSPPASPPRVFTHSSSPSSRSPHSSLPGRCDKFIADRRALADYLRQCELVTPEPSLAHSGWTAGPALPVGEVLWPSTPAVPHHHTYQHSPIDNESVPGAGESSPEAGREEGARGSRSPPQVLRRLQLDPQRLTQFHLNLRLWIHVTILERLVSEMERLDNVLATAGAEARVGSASLERLAAAAAGASGASSLLTALQPFLEPFADQRYLVQRVRELARGGCLSGYRWDGGGADWEESRPTDAELVLQLFASYLDVQLPGGGVMAGEVRRPFSSVHLSTAPNPAITRGPRIHRVSRRPPHYVVALPDETLDVGRGRDNLALTLLVFLAAVARDDPPALQRVHLGRAGLNLLWVIGR